MPPLHYHVLRVWPEKRFMISGPCETSGWEVHVNHAVAPAEDELPGIEPHLHDASCQALLQVIQAM